MFRTNGKDPFFNYWELSYRKKFFRTLWLLPFPFGFFLFPADFEFFGIARNPLTAIVFFLLLVQTGYTFYRWKKADK